MTRPLLLDLFCGAGGAAMGYHRAGFDVVGVDIKPQPHYPFEFVQMDALEYPASREWRMGFFDAIHASPPCQRWTAYGRRPRHVGAFPDLIGQTRELLRSTGLPYVIENVPRAPLENPVQLCGSAFGLDVRRHRRFESNLPLMGAPCVHGQQQGSYPQATNRTNRRRTVEIGVWRIPLAVQQAAMGIDWMELEELSEAIPPAYTSFLGEQLLEHLNRSELWVGSNCDPSSYGVEMNEDFETVRYHLVEDNPDSTTELDAYTALDRIESQLRSLTEENERLREALARWHVLHPEPHEDPGDNA